MICSPFPAPRLKTEVSQTHDASYINEIANAPGVREFVGGTGLIDVTMLLESSVALATDKGVIVLEWRSPGVYCFHTMFLPEGRGRHAFEAASNAAEWMFTRTDALELHTYTPFDNPKATPPRSFGFRFWFKGQDADFYRLNVNDWATNAPNLETYGRWFHEQLKAAGQTQSHADLAANDRFAGMAAAMALRGQERKAVALYNIWALTAGFYPARIISEDPFEIDTGDAIWRIVGEQAEIVSCQ